MQEKKERPDHKIKTLDVLIPLGGYVRYRMRNSTFLMLDHPDTSLRSKLLFLYHTTYGTAVAVGAYKLAESALEMIAYSF